MPDETPAPAAQKTVDAIVRQAMNDHLRSLIAGQPERVRHDFAESIRDRTAELESLVPRHLKSYDFLEDRVEADNTSRMVVRLQGDESRELEWVWRSVDGRFRIVEIRPAAR